MSNPNEEAANDTTQKINKAFAPINTNDRQVKRSFFISAKSLRKHRYSAKRVILSIGFIILVTIGGVFVANFFSNKSTGGTTNQIKSVFSGEELKDYTSPENKFTILMPGIPQISTTTKKSGDKDIAITTYQRIIDNDTKNYTFAIYDYSGIQLDEPKALEAALNSAMQNTPGAELKSTKVGKYNDLNAIEATYNVADKDKIYEAHIRYVMKESKMYAMIIIGGDQAKFDEFANSLRLN